MLTKDVGVQRDFYNVTLSDGSTTDAFEHLFADIEDTVASAFRRLTSSPPMWPAPRVAAFERMSAAVPDRDDDGLTIDDLTWPIPGRRSNVVRHPPGAQGE
ncbi:MAG TPA: hypothetical protein VGD71_17615 [Kribbella sp.]